MWEYIDGDGLWKRYKNTVTNQESITDHELRLVKRWCPQNKHIFEITGNRSLKCKKCGQEVTWICGKQKVEDGKLIDL